MEAVISDLTDLGHTFSAQGQILLSMRRQRLVVSAPLDASVPEPGYIAEAERDDP
jgi:hypothetical protein